MKSLFASSVLVLAIAPLHAEVAPLPPPVTQEISSFGGCVSDGYVYVYGGHTGDAHDHSRENLSADFLRIPLNQADAAWEKLPEDQAVQGTALVGWKGLVIRVAGMFATNAPNEDSAMFSTDAVRCYDPATRAWSDWPSLPDKVSSHDALVIGDTLYVVGGWKLDGPAGEGKWHEHGWRLDLENRDQGWKALPPMPAPRRAGSVAAASGELWWVGGMGSDDKSSNDTFAFDPEKGVWRPGPELPITSETKAFGNSTFSSGDKLFTSAMDGALYSLDPAESEWAVTPVNHERGRIFHRSVPVGDGIFWTIAGASRQGHRSDIEVLPIPGQFPGIKGAAWPSFRGGANNVVSTRKMTERWSDDANIAWKVSLPGYGQSTPVYGQGGVYVTSSVGAEKAEVAVTRIDQSSGKIAWTTTLPCADPEEVNKYRSCAAPSPCLDDQSVYAWFESGDLVALNHGGEKQWHRNLGKEYGLPKGNHGLGGSVVQDQESLYILVDHDGPSYLLCIDKRDGQTRWKTDRPKRVSWSTPVVTGDALIICSNGLVEERDKATGEQRWVVEGITGNTVASPLVFEEFVLAPSSEKGQTQLLRRGDTGERVVWKADQNTASFASPVFSQGQIVLVSKASIASGLDWRTGKELWNFRLPDGCWATPIVLGRSVYFFSTSGTTLVARLAPGELHESHRNVLTLESSKVYGVIPAGDQWIIRTGSEVIAIAAPKGA